MTTQSDDLHRLESQAADRKPTGKPPIAVDKGHFGISIDADGVWSHGGTTFPRIALAKLFSTVMKRDAAGVYWLETPVERGRIDVADAPFVAVEMAATGVGDAQNIRFRTNLDDWVALDAAHPLRVEIDPETEEPRPYVEVRDRLEARLLRPVFLELADLADEVTRPGMLGVWSHGLFHELGPAEETAP